MPDDAPTDETIRFTPAEFEAFKRGYRQAVLDDVLSRVGRHAAVLPGVLADGLAQVALNIRALRFPAATPDERRGAEIACRAVADMVHAEARSLRGTQLEL